MALAKSTGGRLAPAIVATAARRGNEHEHAPRSNVQPPRARAACDAHNVYELRHRHARLLPVVDALPLWQAARAFLKACLLAADRYGYLWDELETIRQRMPRSERVGCYSIQMVKLSARVCRDAHLARTAERLYPLGHYPERRHGSIVLDNGLPVGRTGGGAVRQVALPLLGELGRALEHEDRGVCLVGPFVVLTPVGPGGVVLQRRILTPQQALTYVDGRGLGFAWGAVLRGQNACSAWSNAFDGGGLMDETSLPEPPSADLDLNPAGRRPSGSGPPGTERNWRGRGPSSTRSEREQRKRARGAQQSRAADARRAATATAAARQPSAPHPDRREGGRARLVPPEVDNAEMSFRARMAIASLEAHCAQPEVIDRNGRIVHRVRSKK